MLDLGLVDRRFGYPLEMVVRAARARSAPGRTGRAYARARRTVKVSGSVRGTIRAAYDMSRVLAR